MKEQPFISFVFHDWKSERVDGKKLWLYQLYHLLNQFFVPFEITYSIVDRQSESKIIQHNSALLIMYYIISLPP